MKNTKRSKLKNYAATPCCFCKRPMVKPHSAEALENPGLVCSEEHYIPRSRGGSSDEENIRYSCSRCNNLKDSIMPEIFEPFARMVISRHPDTITPILKDALKQYIMSLAEIAVRNNVATKKAALVSLLQMSDMLKGRGF
jgi:Ribonuclease G/E